MHQRCAIGTITIFCATSLRLCLQAYAYVIIDEEENAGKTLSIYPDGGFINGWLIYNRPGRRHEYDMATIMHDTEVNICRNQDIKYDVTIEDVTE